MEEKPSYGALSNQHDLEDMPKSSFSTLYGQIQAFFGI